MREQSQEWQYVVILEQKDKSTAKMQCCFCDKIFTRGALRVVRDNVFFVFCKSKKNVTFYVFCIASHVFSNYAADSDVLPERMHAVRNLLRLIYVQFIKFRKKHTDKRTARKT